MSKKVVIIGAGGHAKVIADIIEKSGDIIYGFLDDNLPVDTKIVKEYKVLGKIDKCIELQNNEDIYFIIGIGNNYFRKKINDVYKLKYYTAIHPTAVIAINTNIKEGSVIMANSCINTSSKIGRHCIINTGTIIEHDCYVGDYIHISPNATLCGTVTVGEFTHIGAGVTIINNINITSDCIIGAGGVVVKDIKEKGTYVGVPVKKIK